MCRTGVEREQPSDDARYQPDWPDTSQFYGNIEIDRRSCPGIEGKIEMEPARRARARDIAGIRAMVRHAYGHYESRLGLRPAPMDDDYARRVSEDEAWVMATETGRVAGLLVLVARTDHLLLDNIAVDPEYQGQGIGRALLDLAERRAREQGMESIRLYTNELMVENQRLYERVGYVETHRREEHGFSRVHYMKDLHRAETGHPDAPAD